MDAIQLALWHTSLPVHLPFVDEHRREALFKAITHGEPMQLRLGTAPARLTCARALRLCPKCVRQDRTKFGRTYWHREHQLPGMLSCPYHGCALAVTSVRPEYHHGAASFATPMQAGPVRPEPFDKVNGRHARWLSRELARLLQPEVPRPGPTRLHAYYLHLLKCKGYSQPNGSVSVSKLSADITSHYGPAFLKHVGCLPGGWVATIVRSPRNHQQPLRHLLLLGFLGRSVGHLHEALAAAHERPASAPHPFRIKNPSRLARLRPVYRRDWLKFLEAGRTKENGRLSVYAWLHRNDRLWLRAHRAPRVKRVANASLWTERDADLAKKVPELARSIRQEHPARRASRSAIASATVASSWLAHDHPYLPLASAAIKAAAETPEQYAIRRIELLGPELMTKGPLPVWKIRTLAGISTTLASKRAVEDALRRAANYSRLPRAAQAESNR